MNAPTNRRQFLRSGAALVALPMLESLQARAAVAHAAPKAKRLVCIGTFLGLHTPAFYPAKAGRDYEMTGSLKPLAALRDDLTIFSGLDHRAPSGHQNWANYLCGKRIGDLSLDQRVAKQIGEVTRFSS